MNLIQFWIIRIIYTKWNTAYIEKTLIIRNYDSLYIYTGRINTKRNYLYLCQVHILNKSENKKSTINDKLWYLYSQIVYPDLFTWCSHFSYIYTPCPRLDWSLVLTLLVACTTWGIKAQSYYFSRISYHNFINHFTSIENCSGLHV